MTEVKPGDVILLRMPYGCDLGRVRRVLRQSYRVEVMGDYSDCLMLTSVRKGIRIISNLGPLSPEQFTASAIAARAARKNASEMLRIFTAAFDRIVAQNIVSAAKGDA